ncbi:hypothetical protein NDU88_005633 [Pleurodeles waltl]|uniref:Uncharacterized protein n=1 Tax=Pleurodeles waltl TaxID=8319 RepID=A0AAV7PGH8_PLEWA|nr:hypothetical protein NDU88_005633 [Pleurodeles waltl]
MEPGICCTAFAGSSTCWKERGNQTLLLKLLHLMLAGISLGEMEAAVQEPQEGPNMLPLLEAANEEAAKGSSQPSLSRVAG